mmetsp:Transcript_25974/g.69416  ORF Transcript_25974/g.69416 Transcript_25974/m.69416 type:complete len:225 (+) Transcript_25974:359-1033(+)
MQGARVVGCLQGDGPEVRFEAVVEELEDLRERTPRAHGQVPRVDDGAGVFLERPTLHGELGPQMLSQHRDARVRHVLLSYDAGRLESVVGKDLLEEAARRVHRVRGHLRPVCEIPRVPVAQVYCQLTDIVGVVLPGTLLHARLTPVVAHEGPQVLRRCLAEQALRHSQAAAEERLHVEKVAVELQIRAWRDLDLLGKIQDIKRPAGLGLVVTRYLFGLGQDQRR